MYFEELGDHSTTVNYTSGPNRTTPGLLTYKFYEPGLYFVENIHTKVVRNDWWPSHNFYDSMFKYPNSASRLYIENQGVDRDNNRVFAVNHWSDVDYSGGSDRHTYSSYWEATTCINNFEYVGEFIEVTRDKQGNLDIKPIIPANENGFIGDLVKYINNGSPKSEEEKKRYMDMIYLYILNMKKVKDEQLMGNNSDGYNYTSSGKDLDFKTDIERPVNYSIFIPAIIFNKNLYPKFKIKKKKSDSDTKTYNVMGMPLINFTPINFNVNDNDIRTNYIDLNKVNHDDNVITRNGTFGKSGNTAFRNYRLVKIVGIIDDSGNYDDHAYRVLLESRLHRICDIYSPGAIDLSEEEKYKFDKIIDYLKGLFPYSSNSTPKSFNVNYKDMKNRIIGILNEPYTTISDAPSNPTDFTIRFVDEHQPDYGRVRLPDDAPPKPDTPEPPTPPSDPDDENGDTGVDNTVDNTPKDDTMEAMIRRKVDVEDYNRDNFFAYFDFKIPNKQDQIPHHLPFMKYADPKYIYSKIINVVFIKQLSELIESKPIIKEIFSGKKTYITAEEVSTLSDFRGFTYSSNEVAMRVYFDELVSKGVNDDDTLNRLNIQVTSDYIDAITYLLTLNKHDTKIGTPLAVKDKAIKHIIGDFDSTLNLNNYQVNLDINPEKLIMYLEELAYQLWLMILYTHPSSKSKLRISPTKYYINFEDENRMNILTDEDGDTHIGNDVYNLNIYTRSNRGQNPETLNIHQMLEKIYDNLPRITLSEHERSLLGEYTVDFNKISYVMKTFKYIPDFHEKYKDDEYLTLERKGNYEFVEYYIFLWLIHKLYKNRFQARLDRDVPVSPSEEFRGTYNISGTKCVVTPSIEFDYYFIDMYSFIPETVTYSTTDSASKEYMEDIFYNVLLLGELMPGLSEFNNEDSDEALSRYNFFALPYIPVGTLEPGLEYTNGNDIDSDIHGYPHTKMAHIVRNRCKHIFDEPYRKKYGIKYPRIGAYVLNLMVVWLYLPKILHILFTKGNLTREDLNYESVNNTCYPRIQIGSVFSYLNNDRNSVQHAHVWGIDPTRSNTNLVEDDATVDEDTGFYIIENSNEDEKEFSVFIPYSMVKTSDTQKFYDRLSDAINITPSPDIRDYYHFFVDKTMEEVFSDFNNNFDRRGDLVNMELLFSQIDGMPLYSFKKFLGIMPEGKTNGQLEDMPILKEILLPPVYGTEINMSSSITSSVIENLEDEIETKFIIGITFKLV